VVNIKETTYNYKHNNTSSCNSALNKSIVYEVLQMEGLNNKLISYVEDKMNEIDLKQQRVLKDIKNALKSESEENKKLLDKLKAYQT
jgi:hypothetical protein